jgi:2-dehydropantoate 2-reductase
MKIVVVGPGAIGSLFAALLAKSKSANDVWLLDNDPQRAKRLSSSGIKVEGVSDFSIKIKITPKAQDIGKADLIIIAVKSHDTEPAVKSIAPILTDETKVLTIQNGVGNLEIISEVVGENRALAGETSHGATLAQEGRVVHAGAGETIIGALDGKIFGDLRAIANVFNDAKIKTKMSKDIKTVIWSKLIVNVGINALTALTRLTNGQLIKSEEAKEVLRQAVSEAVKVAKRKGIKLLYDDPLQKVESVCAATSSNVCSMLQDILHKRTTEIDAINGAISRHGRSLGVKTPVNDILFALVKTIESNYDKQVNADNR